MKSYLIEIRNEWKAALADKNFRMRFVFTLLLLALILAVLARFLDYNEERPGFSFADPLLSTFSPIDVTWFTFILIYGALIIGLVSLAKHPRRIMITFQAYTLVCAMRIITIYFLPLNAPFHIIPLKDPFVEFFGGGETMLKDLFFSGHTATMFLLMLVTKNTKLKTIFIILTILVATCVLVQHVHYTIDVVAAPFIAYTSYRIAKIINRKKFSR